MFLVTNPYCIKVYIPYFYTISRDPGMYRDSLQMLDSPQLTTFLLHCSHLLYLSHCSCTRRLGLSACNRSSISLFFFNVAAFCQSPSRRLRVWNLLLNLLPRSSINLQEENTSGVIIVILYIFFRGYEYSRSTALKNFWNVFMPWSCKDDIPFSPRCTKPHQNR